MNGSNPATSVGPTAPAARLLRGVVELAAGAYAFAAVTGLRGTAPTPGAWAGVLGFFLAAAGLGWFLRRAERPAWLVEIVLLAAGILGLAAWPGVSDGMATGLLWRVLALGLQGVARAGAGEKKPGWDDQLRVLLLFALAAISLQAYLSPNLVGPKDARWYGNAAFDFLTRLRAGEFPVFSGESIFAFNGNVQLVRSAPAHLHLAALADLLTGRSLAPLALQHVALLGCHLGGVLFLYAALARLRPADRWLAAAFAAVYATSPALLTLLAVHDMYMTFTALPALLVACSAAARVTETGAWRHFAWLGAACAAMWLGHPPIAFLGTLAAGIFLGANAVGEGITGRWVLGCGLTAAVFLALAGPYLFAMSEIPPTHVFYPVENLILPVGGLFLLALALVRLARGSFRWLPALFLAGLVLREFKPSLLPFAGLVAGFFLLAALLERRWPGLGVRERPEPWLTAGAVVAAAISAAWLPESLLPAREIVRAVVGTPLGSLSEFLRRIIAGADAQPHAVWWWLLLAGLVLMWRSPGRFGRVALAVALAAVLSILPVPLLKAFLWGNTTVEIWDILVDADWLRFWPFALPVLLFAVFPMLADLPRGSRGRKVFIGGLLVLLPWALWTHYGNVRGIFVRGAVETARLYRPENIILQSYSWDLLRQPSYYLSGVIDPRLEVRLWRQGPGRELLLDPDRIAQQVEAAGGARLDLQATQDPTYPQWVYLAPKIELQPGETKLLRFDFKGRQPVGWLIVRGQETYRDYVLPSSGLERSFGAGPLNTRTIAVMNSGTAPESIELVIKREGPAATAPVVAADFPAVFVSRYEPERAPVQIRSLSPLVLRVSAPEPGMLEVFRSAYPGYRVSVNGKNVPYISSRDGLVALAVPAGENEVVIRFRGTWQLRLAFWWSLSAWVVTGLAALAGLFCAAGCRRHAGVA